MTWVFNSCHDWLPSWVIANTGIRRQPYVVWRIWSSKVEIHIWYQCGVVWLQTGALKIWQQTASGIRRSCNYPREVTTPAITCAPCYNWWKMRIRQLHHNSKNSIQEKICHDITLFIITSMHYLKIWPVSVEIMSDVWHTEESIMIINFMTTRPCMTGMCRIDISCVQSRVV